VYTLKDLSNCCFAQAEINGRWVPARPLPFYGLFGFWLRLKDAWAVLTGRADAFIWPEGQ